MNNQTTATPQALIKAAAHTIRELTDEVERLSVENDALLKKSTQTPNIVLEKVASTGVAEQFVQLLVDAALIKESKADDYRQAIIETPDAALKIAAQAIKSSASAAEDGRGIKLFNSPSTASTDPQEVVEQCWIDAALR
ncbi:MAG: hypothetical protein RR382_00975 [Tannerellaceae bacterium]